MDFEKLDVYKLAERMGNEIWKLVIHWKHFEKDTIGKQMVRSADSVGANIAEGTGRGTYLDNKRFVRMARASLYETRHWLRRACHCGLINNTQSENINSLIDELSPRLNAYLKSIGTAKIRKN